MDIPYILKVKSIDERGLGDRSEGSDPRKLVLTLASAKADALIKGLEFVDDNGQDKDKNINEDKNDLRVDQSIYPQHKQKGWIMLTADTVVTHNNCILEKPDDINQAIDFINRYGQSSPSTVLAVVLTHLPSGKQVSGVDIATIHFKSSVATCDLISRLVEEGAPVLSCAGGLMIENPLVREHIDRIEGTEDSVMGLSKDLVLRLLDEMSDLLKEDQ